MDRDDTLHGSGHRGDGKARPKCRRRPSCLSVGNSPVHRILRVPASLKSWHIKEAPVPVRDREPGFGVIGVGGGVGRLIPNDLPQYGY